MLQVDNLLSATRDAGNVLVSSKGWFIFGGYESELTTSQKLISVDAEWEAGPDLFEKRTDYGHCMVQV